VYTTTTSFDALDRSKKVQYPVDVSGARKELVPEFNQSGALQRVRLDGTVYVEHIAYNAKGQRTVVRYGNGILKVYEYDSQTARLRRMFTAAYAATPGVDFSW